MSGRMSTPFFRRISSALGVVGPLAPSARIRQRTRPALAAVIWFSRAAGTRMSHSTSRHASACPAFFPRGSSGWSRSSAGAPGAHRCRGPSATPRSRPTRPRRRSALGLPRGGSWRRDTPRCRTLDRHPLSGQRAAQRYCLRRERWRKASRSAKTIPRPVASLRPEMPPWETGLPVTQAMLSRWPGWNAS